MHIRFWSTPPFPSTSARILFFEEDITKTYFVNYYQSKNHKQRYTIKLSENVVSRLHFLAPLRAYVLYGWPLLDSIKVSNRVCLNPTKAGLFWGSKSRGGGGATSTHHLPFLYFSPNQMKIGRNTHHHVNFHFLSGKDFDCPKFCWREQKISKNMVKTMPY